MADGETRRLAAIMASDVVGYSALMGTDEVGTVSAMRVLRKDLWGPKIEEYGGRVVKSTGDGLLVEFPSVADAVQCAVEMQRAMARRNADIPEDHRIVLRIGINQGDVIVEGDDIFGDGVNVAARLEGLAEPGGICISRAVRDQIRDKLLYELEDLGEQELKNIARPVEVFRVSIEETGDAAAANAPPPPRKPPEAKAASRPSWLWPVSAAAAVVLIAVIAVGGWLITRGDDDVRLAATDPATITATAEAPAAEEEDPILAMPTGPRIAILPFDNLSGDPEQEYFSDGMTEDLITELARFKDLRVLARNTTFQYKGESVDVEDVGRALNVEFVLEGSVQRSGDTVRVTAQLIDVATGAHLWAQRYDRPLADIFAVQDEITGKIVATLASQFGGVLTRAGSKSIHDRAPSDLEAYELVLRASNLSPVASFRSNYQPAKELLMRAVEKDPNYARAYADLARLTLRGWMSGLEGQTGSVGDIPAPPPRELVVAAIKAVAIDPTDPSAHVAAAFAYFFDQQLDLFERSAEKAMELAPNDAAILTQMGALIGFTGQWDRGVAIVEKANELNPLSAAGWYHTTMFYDLYRKGRYEEALAIIRQHPVQGTWETQFKYVIGNGQLGNGPSADEARARLAAINSDWTVEEWGRVARMWNFQETDIAKFQDGLRKAGVPEDDVLALPRGPRIAVLAFDNLSGDPEQEYFSDGITEEIITQLSRFSNLFVLARNTTFQYKGRAVDVRKIGEELDVRYVLEGSIRRAADTVRVTVQLIDTNDGAHIWAESYDRPLTAASLFEVQDDIAEKVTGAIGATDGAIARFAQSEIRGRRTNDLSAYECVLVGFNYYTVITPETHLRARDCLERAVELDPEYADAWGILSYTYIDEARYRFNPRPDQYDAIQRGFDAARRAAELDSTNQTAQAALALVHFMRQDIGQFRPALERTVEANPNNSSWLAFMGVLLTYSGNAERGVQFVRKAQALNPAHPGWYHMPLSFERYLDRDYEAALVEAQKINMPGFYRGLLFLAPVYGQLGRMDEAREAVAELSRLRPGYSVEQVAQEGLFLNMPEEDMQHLQEGLRKAGLPEVSKDE